MRNIYITFFFLIFCSMAYAQGQAKYRVTYSIGFAVGGVGEVVGAPAGALIGGFFGYISGRKVSETVYDVVTQKGMPIGGR